MRFYAVGIWWVPGEAVRMSRSATFSPVFVPEGLWAVDPDHSEVRFSVKHLLVATVKGRFGTVEGTISADGRKLKAEGSVQVATIETGMADRDSGLRGDKFFDVATYPQITFRATDARPGSRGTWTVTGDLTTMGHTGPLTFTATVAEGVHGPRITAHGSLSRREHDLDWPGLLHSGRAVVGDRVDIELVLELR